MTRPRILLVEDDDIVAFIAGSQLKRFDLDFDRAINGADAVEATQKAQYDLILMDIQMPTLNGFEATIQIRILEKFSGHHSQIMGVTASDNRVDCIAAGMDDYASKPANYDLIIARFFPTCAPFAA